MLWNALAGRLWCRTTIYLYRTLARAAVMTEAELRRVVRISFAKVAEYQKRGAVHFHAVIRLDAPTACTCPACVLPPPEEFTAALLEEAVKEAAATVAVACPPVDEDQGVTLIARWGEQLHVRHLTRDDGEDDKKLLAEQVAGYVAKYATAMIPVVVAVGSDPGMRLAGCLALDLSAWHCDDRESGCGAGLTLGPHRPGAWLKTCRPVATAATSGTDRRGVT